MSSVIASRQRRRGIYESAAFVKGKKHSMNTKYELAMIKPVLPEASIRHLSGMSIFSRGVAINLTALKEPATPRAYPCFGKVFR